MNTWINIAHECRQSWTILKDANDRLYYDAYGSPSVHLPSFPNVSSLVSSICHMIAREDPIPDRSGPAFNLGF